MENSIINELKGAVKYWYILLIVGLIMIITGIWTFSHPVGSYLALSIVFAISFLVSGIFEVNYALSNRNIIHNWGWSFVLGALSAVIGIMMLIHPAISLTTLPFYVGFVLMFRSFGAIGASLDMKSFGVSEWSGLMLLGVLGAIFSFILLYNPLLAGLSVIIWTGLAFLSAGIFYVYISLKMRTLHKQDS